MHTLIRAHTLSQCLQIASEYAQAYEQLGERNFIFCEDRLTLLAERALLARLGGTFRSHVTTFARFLKGNETSISKQGSVMAVGEVMTRLQRDNALKCFTTPAGVGNHAKSIYETLAQFSASQITPDTLRESLALLPEDVLKRKVSDLAEIFDGYTRFLHERGYLDESRYLSLLPDKIRGSEQLKGANVFFLGYPAFTAQAKDTLRAAFDCAKNVVGIFCGGDEDIYTNRAAMDFKAVAEEYGKPQILQLGTPLNSTAETLRKGLFDPVQKQAEKCKTQQIHLFEAEGKVAEAEYVAVQIRRAMQENEALRFRDFTVLVPDVSSYSLALKRAFGEYNLPYFIDEKRSLKSHPLARFLLDCFKTVQEKFSTASVQALTENYFFGESDEYRNYLLKYANYRGGAKREIKNGDAIEKNYRIPRLEDARKRLLLATQGIKNKAKGAEYCAAIRQIMLDFDVKNKLETLESDMTDVAHKGYLAQIYRALDGLLGEATLLTGERSLTVAEFSAILQDGLDATEISLIPLKSDAIFVGAIAESRVGKAEILFALGMTDQIPSVAVDTAIVSDKEIAKLKEVKTLLEPTVAEVNLRNRESVCLNLCAFEKELHVCYPVPADGGEATRSEVFYYVDRLFEGTDGQPLPTLKKIPDQHLAYQCSAPTPALRKLLLEREEFERRKTDSRQAYASIFTALDKLSVTEKDDFLMERDRQVRVERGEDLFFKNGKISPTSLEGYFTCPFKNFVERGLRLKEREETAVLAVDTGNFIHELLEITTKQMSQTQTEEEMREIAKATALELMQNPVYAAQSDTASGAYFSEKLVAEGTQVVLAAFHQLKNSKFIVEETEKNIATPAIHGKVDRVDGTDKYVRIIDYKTGSIDESPVSYYVGKKLQMQLYMSALKGERVPAGVFYFPASMDYADTDEGRFKMKGFLNGDTDALLCGDTTLTEGASSEFFQAKLGNNATSKRVMDEQTFRDFLDYSLLVARQGCQEMKDGNVAPSPYKGGCDYCKYGGMCGFRTDCDTVRNEPTIDPPTIAEIARKARDGEGK